MVLTAFALTKGNITASDAAKKIRDTPPSAGTVLNFTEKTVIAYDDKAGTFTVKVKGSKDGKPFEKELTVTGFTHPYTGTSLVALTTLGNVLVFDKAIEENMALDSFITAATAADGIGYASFSYQLNNGNGKTAKTGKYSAYELTARLTKVQGDKIKIMADYKIVYKKLTEGGSETDESVVSTAQVREKEPYFTEDDVLKYVFGKTNDSFVKVDSNKFASYYYAMSKFSNTSTVDFDMTQIQTYVDLYCTKDPGEHLKVDIQAGINNPKNGGIEANDFTGELTVDYCIATTEQLENQSGILHSRSVTKKGFQKIQTGDDIRRHFIFTVRLSPSGEDSKTKWQDKVLNDFRLFYVDESSLNPSGVLDNPFPEPASTQNPYVLSLCDVGNPLLGAGNYGLSKDTNNNPIYIKHISLSKEANSNKLKVRMQLCGGEIVEMTTEPFLGYNP